MFEIGILVTAEEHVSGFRSNPQDRSANLNYTILLRIAAYYTLHAVDNVNVTSVFPFE